MLKIPTWLLDEGQLADAIATWRDVLKNADDPASEDEIRALKELEDYALDFRGVVVTPREAYIVHGATL